MKLDPEGRQHETRAFVGVPCGPALDVDSGKFTFAMVQQSGRPSRQPRGGLTARIAIMDDVRGPQ